MRFWNRYRIWEDRHLDEIGMFAIGFGAGLFIGAGYIILLLTQ